MQSESLYSTLSIRKIDIALEEFNNDSDLDKYLERLPIILFKTFELGSNAIKQAENLESKNDILKLIELTTFELSVNNKKELKVKLFDVLDKFITSDLSLLEAPSGVEPLYKALQASA